MMIDTAPARHRGDWGRSSAWAAGLVGLAANVVLILFASLGRIDARWDWLGRVGLVLLSGQVLTLVPVAVALRRALPRSPAVTAATAAVVVGALPVGELFALTKITHLALRVAPVVLQLVLVCTWVIMVSSLGHRSGALPRPVTQLGLVVGAAVLIGLVIIAPSLWFPGSSVAQLALVGPGAVIGGLGWLALPIWCLSLARLAFGRALSSAREGAT